MIDSMYGLDHRLSELRPSERDHEVARQLRDAASPATRVVRTIRSSTGPWRHTVRLGGEPTRLGAG
jgi:hypothetical protein